MGAAQDALNAFASQIDMATNDIATRIQALIDQVNSGGASAEEITAALQPEVDRLKVLGTNPPKV